MRASGKNNRLELRKPEAPRLIPPTCWISQLRSPADHSTTAHDMPTIAIISHSALQHFRWTTCDGR